MPGQIPIFVINLDKATDRLERISTRLSEFGLSFERVPAVNGKHLSESDRLRIDPRRFWLMISDSEAACYLSHLKALELIVSRRLPQAIILEDDAIFDDDFPRWVDSRLEYPEDLHILKLEGFGAEKTIRIPVLSCATKTIDFAFRPTGGAAAYLITLGGAEKALRVLKKVRGQVDYDLFNYGKTGLVTYELRPFPVRQDGTPSTITHDHTARTLKFRLSRYYLKNYDKFLRLQFFVRRFGISPFIRHNVAFSR
jgi:glycosyl transferase family 25